MSAKPLHAMAALRLSKSTVARINKPRRHVGGGCQVAWPQACRSKDEGGLGIIDIELQNKCLLKTVDLWFVRYELITEGGRICDFSI
jgi:hypothetical protein